jgi:hypothetical protein
MTKQLRLFVWGLAAIFALCLLVKIYHFTTLLIPLYGLRVEHLLHPVLLVIVITSLIWRNKWTWFIIVAISSYYWLDVVLGTFPHSRATPPKAYILQEAFQTLTSDFRSSASFFWLTLHFSFYTTALFIFFTKRQILFGAAKDLR